MQNIVVHSVRVGPAKAKVDPVDARNRSSDSTNRESEFSGSLFSRLFL